MGYDNKNNWISDIGIGTDNQNLYQKLNFALTTKYLFQNLDKLDMPSQSNICARIRNCRVRPNN